LTRTTHRGLGSRGSGVRSLKKRGSKLIKEASTEHIGLGSLDGDTKGNSWKEKRGPAQDTTLPSSCCTRGPNTQANCQKRGKVRFTFRGGENGHSKSNECGRGLSTPQREIKKKQKSRGRDFWGGTGSKTPLRTNLFRKGIMNEGGGSKGGRRAPVPAVQ